MLIYGLDTSRPVGSLIRLSVHSLGSLSVLKDCQLRQYYAWCYKSIYALHSCTSWTPAALCRTRPYVVPLG